MKRTHLGKISSVYTKPNFSILDPIKRNTYDNQSYGFDIWNAYEFTFLNKSKIPTIEVLEIIIPSNSINTIESKSLKLYLGSYYNQVYKNAKEALLRISNDISRACKTRIKISTQKSFDEPIKSNELVNQINQLNHGNFLSFKAFRSICPVTHQPDLASIYFKTSNKTIPSKEICEFLMSFREEGSFHEDCIEKIYSKLANDFKLNKLTVLGRFLRRGGIDINPIRSYKKKLKITNNRDRNQ